MLDTLQRLVAQSAGIQRVKSGIKKINVKSCSGFEPGIQNPHDLVANALTAESQGAYITLSAFVYNVFYNGLYGRVFVIDMCIGTHSVQTMTKGLFRPDAPASN